MTPFSPEVDLAALSPTIALGPLDGRYRQVVAPLVNFLSEPALNRMRLYLEVEWLITVTREVPGATPLSSSDLAFLRRLPQTFGELESTNLKRLEAQTAHDVKAVEYLLKQRIVEQGSAALQANAELVHFGLTSEDINNLAYALLVGGAVSQVWLPSASGLAEQLTAMAWQLAEQPMLARTHGQAATPTTLGKELAVFAYRLDRQVRRVAQVERLGKLNGATGTYGALQVAMPEVDWPAVSRSFIEGLGLTWNPLTTQIEPHDWQGELCDALAGAGRVLHNLATDIWTYISLGYFVQEPVVGTTGSSAMPHKVNPIRFENAEANLEVADALLGLLSRTLTTSRLQRDLSDSSVQRNVGVALGHSHLAIVNLQEGLRALHPNPAALERDLGVHWEVLAEPVQTAMRVAGVAGAAGMSDPFERLREFSRGRAISAADLRNFVVELDLPPELRERLLALTPRDYTGLASDLVREYLPKPGDQRA